MISTQSYLWVWFLKDTESITTLTDTDAFYIITDVPNGMKMFTRAPLTTAMEGDFDTGNVRYKARERYSFGVSDPRGIFGVEGA